MTTYDPEAAAARGAALLDATPDNDLLPVIRRAVGDPGSFLPRDGMRSVPAWCARAVLIALREAGYAVMPVAASAETVGSEARR